MESSIKYQPKFGRVLIEREIETKTTGGIIIPENAAKRHASCVGKIVALGETAGWTETWEITDYSDREVQRIAVQTLQVGDKVIFGKHSGAWLDATYTPRGEANDDGTLFICQDVDILAVIKE